MTLQFATSLIVNYQVQLSSHKRGERRGKASTLIYPQHELRPKAEYTKENVRESGFLADPQCLKTIFWTQILRVTSQGWPQNTLTTFFNSKKTVQKPHNQTKQDSRRKSDWAKKAPYLKKEHPCGYNNLRDFFFLYHFSISLFNKKKCKVLHVGMNSIKQRWKAPTYTRWKAAWQKMTWGLWWTPSWTRARNVPSLQRLTWTALGTAGQEGESCPSGTGEAAPGELCPCWACESNKDMDIRQRVQ